jgi:hypothetical protein
VTKQAETTDLAVLDNEIDAALVVVDKATGRIGTVIAYANAVDKVHAAVKANWPSFKKLQGSPLGWNTDDKEYPDNVLQLALTDAIIRGAMPFNGEIRVIGGNMYLNKPYFERVVGERPDITDVRLDFDVPEVTGNRAIVGGVLSWRVNGEPGELRFKKTAEADTRIPVRVNNGQGDDAILGKAKRKALAKMLDRIDGSSKWEGKATDDDRTVEGTATPAIEGPKEPPSKAELKKSCAEFTERIKEASSTIEVKNVEKDILAHPHYEHAPPGWKNVLEQWIVHQLEAVADKKPSSDLGAESLDQVFDRFIEQLAKSTNVKAAGAAYDAFFGPESKYGWTPELEAAGAKAFNEHKELVRPK